MIHPYWPLIPGSWIDYQVFEIEGVADRNTGAIGITKRTPVANSPQRITIAQGELPYMRAQCYHNPGTPVPTDQKSRLYEVAYNHNGIDYIGECGASNLQIPPIPVFRESGPRFDVTSGITSYNADGTVNPIPLKTLSTSHWVHGRGAWGQWTDTIRCHLLEDNPQGYNDAVYNYIFARGVGLVDFWFGVLNDAGVIQGTQYYGYRSG